MADTSTERHRVFRGAAVLCDHCRLVVPPGLVDPSAQWQFCCNGCATVFEAIHEAGLDRFYDLAADEGEAATEPAAPSGKRYDEYDDPAFRALYARELPDGSSSIELFLEGVHCASCVWLVERLPRIVDGCLEVRLDLRRQVATVRHDPARVELSVVARALDRLGYPSHPSRAAEHSALRKREERGHLLRLGIAGACAGNVMLAAFALYGGAASGMDPWTLRLLRGWSLAFTLLAVLGPGRVFFVGALGAIRARTAHMDLPVALALTIGTLWGAVNTVRGRGEVYFESLTAVVFLLLLGRWLQHRQSRAAAEAVELLFDLTPSSARRLEIGDDGAESVREVPLAAIEPGDLVEVRPGDSVPADGVVASGLSHVDLSLLTGESLPVPLGPGDRVHAGTVNLEGRLVVEVEAAGAQTRVSRLMQLVERGAADRPPIVRVADRVAHWFVLAVLALAAVTFGLWWRVDPALAVEHTVALLIVTCPCALGLATPLAVQAALGRAASRGILIRSGEALERLRGTGTVLLDKTGTLTEPRLHVIEWIGDSRWRAHVAAAEAQVAHPIARALAALQSELPSIEVCDLRSFGRGLEARVGDHSLRVGSPSFVAARASAAPQAIEAATATSIAAGRTVVWIAVDGSTVAAASLGNPLQEGAAQAVGELRRLGFDVRVLSGDDERVVRAVAAEAGIGPEACEGGASPERKLAVVCELRARGPVMMVGDGVNDAAALAAADFGLAVHGGAEASLAAADAFLSRPGIGAIGDLIHGARRAVRVIQRNFAVSLVYNAVSASLAVAGIIHPAVAAVLMPLSSLSVVTLSYRSRTF
ncbi:heavy metal translocating P-type ATPase [Engelhardtia mirabilis]|uniref:Copper-exporting P-type ATPase A n=1 Tax=Engelhardtia mirabilis TaxID=2528011 RepID=A0A518BII5_9BACT|nr:Copper-exporting P-type ATPase A [Planctomycetes bacterium Pla133]QDV01114.1 Copper-exporting P-type ATPase A [Planctomycetes bacterium Pla86]